MRFGPLLGLGFVLFPFLFAHAEHPTEPDVPACVRSMEESFDLPVKWGFARGEFMRFTDEFPGTRAELRSLSRLAHFIDDPANDELFDFLGAYAQTGFSANAFVGEDIPDEHQHRERQVAIMMTYAASLGLTTLRPELREIEFLAEVLGPLPIQNPFNVRGALEIGLGPTLEVYFNRHRPEIPKLRSLILHSEAAQRAVLFGVQPLGSISREDVLEKLRRRLLDQPAPETPAETGLLDLTESLINRDFEWLARRGAFGVRTPNQARQTFRMIEPKFQMAALGSFFLRHLASVRHLAAEGSLPLLDNPIVVLGRLENTLREDVFINQGLNPLLRRAFVEIVLEKPTLTGNRLRQMARTKLEAIVRDLRFLWRALRHAHDRGNSQATLPCGPTREVRLREYAEQVRVKAQEAGGRKVALPPGFASTPLELLPPAEAPAPNLWDMLLDESRSVSEMRGFTQTVLPVDISIPLDIKRTGFRYHVEFSPRLLKRLLEPAEGEPQDPRAWFEALRLGPARELRQRGWKKLRVPVKGLYDWEIKPSNSLYRMLGYKRSDGVWRFDAIELMH